MTVDPDKTFWTYPSLKNIQIVSTKAKTEPQESQKFQHSETNKKSKFCLREHPWLIPSCAELGPAQPQLVLIYYVNVVNAFSIDTSQVVLQRRHTELNWGRFGQLISSRLNQPIKVLYIVTSWRIHHLNDDCFAKF